MTKANEQPGGMTFDQVVSYITQTLFRSVVDCNRMNYCATLTRDRYDILLRHLISAHRRELAAARAEADEMRKLAQTLGRCALTVDGCEVCP